ncbi:hypothetical protein HYW74_00990 [Candidatus Pacearchaeota archaeon]|nr:hypothetical protein [Candidatus Pacearchaeota archaeon]
MKLTDYLKSAYRMYFPRIKSKREHEEDLKQIERNAVRRHMLSRDRRDHHELSLYESATNRHIIQGNIITQEDADRMKQEVLSYRPHLSLADRVYTFFKKGN